MTLFGVFYSPSGHCPPYGSEFPGDTLAQQYPDYNHSVATIILKLAGVGTATVPTEFTLPAGLPMKGCVFIGMGGGVGSGGTYSMTSNIKLKYTKDAVSSPEPTTYGFGSEFNFPDGTGAIPPDGRSDIVWQSDGYLRSFLVDGTKVLSNSLSQKAAE